MGTRPTKGAGQDPYSMGTAVMGKTDSFMEMVTDFIAQDLKAKKVLHESLTDPVLEPCHQCGSLAIWIVEKESPYPYFEMEQSIPIPTPYRFEFSCDGCGRTMQIETTGDFLGLPQEKYKRVAFAQAVEYWNKSK